ncbi:hypothetical protein BFL35_09520 [Clavibacter michiganensis]|nr:hypothetical protein BFL35_09520 [Clavibacter michiganensis]
MFAWVRPSSGSVARMWIGFVMKRRASATIGPGMVAENSIVWRTAGVCAKSFSMSERNPRSSILSASSSTISRTFESDSRRWPTRSSRRPGVPTTICAPALSCSIWPSYALPP